LYLKFILQSITTVYLISTILIHYFLLPITWKFFLSFQDLTTNNSFYLHFEAKLIEYFNFYVSFYCSCALYCQLFTLFLLLFNYTTISVQAIKKFKKLLYYLFLVLATFVSPPEVLTQIFVFLIFFVVYEYLILLFLVKLKCNYK
jgi:sec-independent protein translocase protein TatC